MRRHSSRPDLMAALLLPLLLLLSAAAVGGSSAAAPCAGAPGCVVIGPGSSQSVDAALTNASISTIVLAGPRHELQSDAWAEYGQDSPFLLTRNVTVTSFYAPYSTLDFRLLQAKLLLASNVTLTLRRLVLQNIKRLGSFDVDFVVGEPGSALLLQDVVRVRAACQQPQDVLRAVRSFPPARPGLPPNQVSLLPRFCVTAALAAGEQPSSRCYNESLHFSVFSLEAVASDAESGRRYRAYLLLQTNTTRVCSTTISPECLAQHAGDDDACIALLLGQGSDGSSAPLAPGAIAGIAVAGAVVAAALLAAVLFRRRIRYCLGCPAPEDSPRCLEPDGFGSHSSFHTLNLPPSDCTSSRTVSQQVSLGVLLGVGSFSQVFRGRWHSRDVAVKIISCTPAELPRVLREAELLMQLQHENVVRAYYAALSNPAEQRRALQARDSRSSEDRARLKQKPGAKRASGRASGSTSSGAGPPATPQGRSGSGSGTPPAGTRPHAAGSGGSRSTGSSRSSGQGVAAGPPLPPPPAPGSVVLDVAPQAPLHQHSTAGSSGTRGSGQPVGSAASSGPSAVAEAREGAGGGGAAPVGSHSSAATTSSSLLGRLLHRGSSGSGSSRQPAAAQAGSSGATAASGAADAAAGPGARTQHAWDTAQQQQQPPQQSSLQEQVLLPPNSRQPDELDEEPAEVQMWLCMELCTAGTLKDAVTLGSLSASDKLGTAKLLSRLLDAANGMTYLHSRGVLHGDLKAANVLLQKSVTAGSYGQVAKISDFGLASVLLDGATHRSTASMGTITHMAPEVLRSGRMSAAADAYAFGILMWEVFTGKSAFAGLHYGVVVERVVVNKERPPVPEHMPDEYRLLMTACWDEEPAKRPAFVQIVSCLELLLDNLHGSSTASSSNTVSDDTGSDADAAPGAGQPAAAALGAQPAGSGRSGSTGSAATTGAAAGSSSTSAASVVRASGSGGAVGTPEQQAASSAAGTAPSGSVATPAQPSLQLQQQGEITSLPPVAGSSLGQPRSSQVLPTSPWVQDL